MFDGGIHHMTVRRPGEGRPGGASGSRDQPGLLKQLPEWPEHMVYRRSGGGPSTVRRWSIGGAVPVLCWSGGGPILAG